MPSELPLPPLMAPALTTLLSGDPSFDESSVRLSQISAMRGGKDDHPGRRVLDAAPHHRTIAKHEMEVRPAGAGISVLKPVRTIRSAPGGIGLPGSTLGLNSSSNRTTSPGEHGGPGGSRVQPQSAPRSFQVFEKTPLFGVAAEHDKYRVEYDELEKDWHKVLFPCLRPASEKDIAMLEEWLDRQLQPFAIKGGTDGMNVTVSMPTGACHRIMH